LHFLKTAIGIGELQCDDQAGDIFGSGIADNCQYASFLVDTDAQPDILAGIVCQIQFD
jgi:hypothetical protein